MSTSTIGVSALSPSRAMDFKTCPLLYRFRCIDRLPEPPTRAATKGTLVHAVLERLFDAPASERTPVRGGELVEPAWQSLLAENPGLSELFASQDEAVVWLDEARELVKSYFGLEDPSRLSPAERETRVEAELASGLRLRGIVDRLDIAPDGAIRIVDYKTGAAPSADFESKALFQLKFYALVLWRERGVAPTALRLVYLKNRRVLDYRPTEQELTGFERTIVALAAAIATALQRKDFPANPNRLCDWCAHQDRCPAFGGVAPPFPTDEEPTLDTPTLVGDAPE